MTFQNKSRGYVELDGSTTTGFVTMKLGVSLIYKGLMSYVRRQKLWPKNTIVPDNDLMRYRDLAPMRD